MTTRLNNKSNHYITNPNDKAAAPLYQRSCSINMANTVPDNDNQQFQDADDNDGNSSTCTEGSIELRITNTGEKKKRKSANGITIPASEVTENDVLVGNATRIVLHPGNIRWKKLVEQQAHKFHTKGKRKETVRWIHSQLGRFLKLKGPTLYTIVSPTSARARTMTALQCMLDQVKEDLNEKAPPPGSPLQTSVPSPLQAIVPNPLQTSIAPINREGDDHHNSSKESLSSSEEEEEEHANKPISPSYNPVERDIIIHRKLRQRNCTGYTDIVVGQIIPLEQLPTHVLASDQVFVTQFKAHKYYDK
jgi:transposase